jgi:FlaA1/EpsC-like NDP-sugar epimerase
MNHNGEPTAVPAAKPSPRIKNWLASLRLSRTSRVFVVLGVYAGGLLASLWLAYQLRFDFSLGPAEQQEFIRNALWILPLKLVLLLGIGQFAGLLSYFSIPDLRRLVLSLGAATLVLGLVWFGSAGGQAPPRSVILADFLLSVLLLSAVRLFFRLAREYYFAPRSPGNGQMARVGIVGAGYAGAILARELSVKRNHGLKPVCFFDDNPHKWDTRVHDIPVSGPPECLLDQKRKLRLDKIIIAMPSAPGRRIREIVKILQQAKLPFVTVPTLDQLATGKVKVSQLRKVEIEDLLGREPVDIETESIRSILEGQVVMVTGAGGSIGSELCRQIAAFSPERVLLVEQSEVQIFQIEQELAGLGYDGTVVPLVADILDYPRMNFIFERYQPDVVFHAAAHKHVPMMERHPCEAIKNNTLGTTQVAELALEYGVKRFVLISTDKAINPTSVMGATKRLAEIYTQALAANRPGATKFMAVRFGNVLGSSGSVVPIFSRQIAGGGPVKVTHPDVERYFMTIPEAVGLVLQSAAQGKGGEIFVLDMGKPIKIVDLARQMIELSGLKPDVDIEVQFTGLRPGEKLYEELSHTTEDCVPTNHPKIMRFISRPEPIKQVQEQLRELTQQLHRAEPDQLKLLLQKIVPDYTPFLENGKGDAALLEDSPLETEHTPV